MPWALNAVKGAGGIAEALYQAKDFAGKDNVLVGLGDNVLESPLESAVQEFLKGGASAHLFLKYVNDPERFGVAKIDEETKHILAIDEKPKRPESNYAVTGFYIYNSEVFDIIRSIEPSDRGELEITDVNNQYLLRSKNEGGLPVRSTILKGYWSDAGTFFSLRNASEFVTRKISDGDWLDGKAYLRYLERE